MNRKIKFREKKIYFSGMIKLTGFTVQGRRGRQTLYHRPSCIHSRARSNTRSFFVLNILRRIPHFNIRFDAAEITGITVARMNILIAVVA